MALGEDPYPGGQFGRHVQDYLTVGHQALGQEPPGPVATLDGPMALPPAPSEAHHFPVAGVSIGELALLDRTAARRVEHHQCVVAFVGVDRYQYFLIAHVSSSSNGRFEGEAGQCNLRRSKPLLSHFLTGWGQMGAGRSRARAHTGGGSRLSSDTI